MFNQFIEKKFKSHASRLNDKEYAKVLDNIVMTSVDAILINSNGEMLLGKRSWFPAKGWWIIGGRMMPGESFEQAAVRNIGRELGLNISGKRFSYLGTYSFVWAKRRQPPQENGSHAVSITMTLTVTAKEKALIKPNEEYGELKWWKPELAAKDSQFLPQLRQYARDISSFLKQYGGKKTN